MIPRMIFHVMVLQEVSFNLEQNLHNIETKEHSPYKQKDNSHSPNAILAYSILFVELEDMHVVDFIVSEHRNTQANCKESVAHHEGEPHDGTAGFDG